MGKGGGKSGGKLAFTLVGALVGGLAFQFGIGVIAGIGIGMSVGSTLWTVTHTPKGADLSDLNTDYSNDDYSRFNTVTNEINQDAVIPVIYGTRKFGGLQVWHNPYNGSRNLQKDVIICESGIDTIYNVCANEELIKNDTDVSIYNIQYPDATVRRSGNNLILYYDNGKSLTYYLGNVDNYNAQNSLLTTIIDKIKSDAGNGWKIDGAIDDRSSKGINANDMGFGKRWNVGYRTEIRYEEVYNEETDEYERRPYEVTVASGDTGQIPCYVNPKDITRTGMVKLDNRGYSIGSFEFHQDETPDNYMEVGGYSKCAWIRADLIASQRLSGSNPTVHCNVKGMKVKVWKNNEFVVEYSENPAWIVYDYLTNKRYGCGLWIKEEMLDLDSFIEVAEYCDEEITYIDYDGKEVNVPRYTLNIVLDSQKKPIEHLSSMLAVFGGFLTINKQIALKVEKAETPVYAFDDSTIVKDSLSIGQTSLEETPNRYKIGYFDPSQNWTEIKVVVEDLELQHEQNNEIYEKVVSLAGCTSQNQALRLGRLYRDLNKVCSLTCSFSVSTQGIMLECGDVITVSYGGIFTNMPFRITEMQDGNNGTYQLTCRQYNPSIYNDSLGASIVNPSYVDDNGFNPYNGVIPTVSNLTTKEATITDTSGNLVTGIIVNWDNIYYKYFNHYNVSVSQDGVNYNTLTNTFDNNAYLTGIPLGINYVSVQVVTSDGIKGSPILSIINITGKDNPPADVNVLDTELLSDGMRRFWWDYDYPEPNDIAGFKIRYTQGNYPSWETGIDLHSGLITHQPFETNTLRQGVNTVMIKAVDNAGNESNQCAYAVLNLGDLLEDNILYHEHFNDNNWGNVLHDGLIDSQGNLVNKDTQAFWSSPQDIMWLDNNSSIWVGKYSELNMLYQAQIPASGQMWLTYEVEGNFRLEYRIVGNNYFWSSADEPFWNGEHNDPIWNSESILWKPYSCKVEVKAGDYIQVRAYTGETNQPTIIKDIQMIIDVKDREMHFENLNVPEEGIMLDITLPNYYTTGVRLDAVQDINRNVYRAFIVQKKPCYIQLLDVNNNPMSAIVDVTWQGFIKEVL